MAQEIQKHITLSVLASMVSQAVSEQFPSELWVVAEISECSVKGAGHCYLSLVERAEQGSAPLAEFKAAIWASKYRMIDSYFRSATGSTLQAGMKIMIRAAISFHPNYGLSLIISDIDPTYTVGETERQRRATIERLEREGLMELQREFALPIVAQRFAVISSATAAGFEDFCKQIHDSPYNISVTLFAALMQGEQTERSVIAALDQIDLRAREFDAVIIIRGGGSASDLRWFDSYELCAAISQFGLPVLTGIGHEKDTSVADMVAFHSFKTPTAVAAGLVDRLCAIDKRLATLQGTVIGLAQNTLLAENARTARTANALQKLTTERLKSAEIKLEKLTSTMIMGARTVIERQTSRLERTNQMIKSAAVAALAKAHSTLELMNEKIESNNPRKILKRGYSIVTSSEGQILKSVSDAHRGTILNIELTDGTIKTEVK